MRTGRRSGSRSTRHGSDENDIRRLMRADLTVPSSIWATVALFDRLLLKREPCQLIRCD